MFAPYFACLNPLLKNTEGSLGQAGKEADAEVYHESCVAPRARRIYRTLSRRILEDEFGYDPLELEMRPKSRYSIRVSMIPMAIQMLQMGGSINEARALVGLPKSAFDSDLDRPYVAATLSPLQSDAEKQAAQEQQAKQSQQSASDAHARAIESAGTNAHALSKDASEQQHQHALAQISAAAQARSVTPATKAIENNPRRSGRFSGVN